MNVYQFKLNATIANLSKLRSRLKKIFEADKVFDDLTEKEILLAMTELFVNIVNHGNMKKDFPVHFTVKSLPTGLEIILRDYGRSYDHTTIIEPDIMDYPETGFGLFLVSSLMDSFEYVPKGNKNDYNLTKLIKYNKVIKHDIPN